MRYVAPNVIVKMIVMYNQLSREKVRTTVDASTMAETTTAAMKARFRGV